MFHHGFCHDGSDLPDAILTTGGQRIAIKTVFAGKHLAVFNTVNPVKQHLVGERTKTVYRLADPITVKVVRVDLDERKIDFELVEAAPPAKKKRKRTKRTRKA